MPGQFTPRVQEALTRLGGKMPYREAAAEIVALWGVGVSAATVQRLTVAHGQVAVALEAGRVRQLQAEGAATTVAPEKLALSADGAMVQLTSGEWREVKMMTLGHIDQSWNRRQARVETRVRGVSYFARLATAASFGEQSLAEWQRRGGSEAQQVVAVADGAPWIQSLVDYHRPDAVRIIDFAHAAAYLGQVAKAVHGEGTAQAQAWFQTARRRLLQQPPQRTLQELAFLQQQHPADSPAAEALDDAWRYLSRREAMIDYPHFRRCGYPVGSGTVESAHKVVMQRRMKQAGMRWQTASVNPMLALRLLICNDRWAAEWPAIAAQRRRQQRQRRLAQTAPPQPPPPVTLASVSVTDTYQPPPAPPPGPRSRKPAPDHPWRRRLLPRRRPQAAITQN